MGESSRAEVVQRVENLVKVPALMIIYAHEDEKDDDNYDDHDDDDGDDDDDDNDLVGAGAGNGF